MRLFILGLRRSGTTIFWESFRRDERLVCYDEPFNRLLIELPVQDAKRTRDEFIALFERDQRRFWDLFHPIDRHDELQSGYSDAQREYLGYLLASAENTVIDSTRSHFKIRALAETVPEAFLIHLHRPAAAWVSSHLAPKGRGLRGRVRTALDRSNFFTRTGRYSYWGVGEIVGSRPESLFGHRVRDAGLDPAEVYALPAIGRMLAFWKIHFEEAERAGREAFGDRFLSVPFADFCADPSGVVRKVYEFVGLEPPALDLAAVHPPNPAYRPDDPRWLDFGRRVGVPADSGLLF